MAVCTREQTPVHEKWALCSCRCVRSIKHTTRCEADTLAACAVRGLPFLNSTHSSRNGGRAPGAILASQACFSSLPSWQGRWHATVRHAWQPSKKQHGYPAAPKAEVATQLPWEQKQDLKLFILLKTRAGAGLEPANFQYQQAGWPLMQTTSSSAAAKSHNRAGLVQQARQCVSMHTIQVQGRHVCAAASASKALLRPSSTCSQPRKSTTLWPNDAVSGPNKASCLPSGTLTLVVPAG